MIRRGLQGDVGEVIQSVLDDVLPDRVHTWCRHIRAHQVAVSFVGQMTGLPIGPKSVECSQVAGQREALTYRQAAGGFIAPNCVDCPFREPVSEDNIGQAIVDRERARRAAAEQRRNEQQATETAVKQLNVPGRDAAAVLASDEQSDQHVRELVGLLANPSQRKEAAAKLRQVARHYPALFSPDLADLLTGLFTYPEIGANIIRVVEHLLEQYPDSLWPPALAGAERAIMRHTHQNLAARIIHRGLEEGRAAPTPELIVLLMENLDPPVRRPYLPGLRRVSRPNVARVYRQSARMNDDSCAQTAARAAIDVAPFARRQAAAAIIVLVDEFGVPAAREFVAPIVAGMALLDEDEYIMADAALRRALSRCVRAAPVEVADAVFSEVMKYSDDVRELALSAFLADDVVGDDVPWLSRLVGLLTDRTTGGQLRTALANRLSDFAQNHAALLQPRLGLMIGHLSMVCTEIDEIRRPPSSGAQPASPMASSERQGRLLHADTVARRLADAIAYVALADADASLPELGAYLRNADSRVVPLFKVYLLRVLGTIGRASNRRAPSIVPLVSACLVDPHSPHVRAAAADACENLTHWNRDVIPEDTLVLVASLLADAFLRPVVESAVPVFGRARVADLDLAASVIRQFVTLYRAYGNSSEHHDLIRDISDALVAVAEQHERLLPMAARLLELMSRDAYFYTADDIIRDFRWFARRHPQFGGLWLRAMLNYYRRFNLKIRLSWAQYLDGPDDDAFEELYRMERTLVVQHASGIADLGRAVPSPRNLRHIAALFMTIGLPAAAAAMFDQLATSLPDERRNEPERCRARALTAALRAEVGLAGGDHDTALELYESAVEQLGEEARLQQAPSHPWDDAEADRRFYEDWFAIRHLLLSLPTREDALATAAAELVDRITEFDTEQLAEREERLRSLVADTVQALVFLARWRAQVLMADSGSAVARDAAVARMAKAMETANAMGDVGPHDALAALVEQVAALTPASRLPPIVEAIRNLALPVPRHDLPFPGKRWNAQASHDDTRSAAAPPSNPVVGVGYMVVSGDEVPGVLMVTSGRVYDCTIDLDVPELPADATRIVLQWVSTLPTDSYDLPHGAITLEHGHRRYRLSGHLRFNHPQAEGSEPASLKLLAEYVTPEGGTAVVELFGRHELRARVYAEGQPVGSSSPAVMVVVQKVMDGMGSILSDQSERDQHNVRAVAEILARFNEYQLVEASFRSTDKEEHLERQLRQFVRWGLGPDVSYTQVQSGSGRIDMLIRGVPVELKVHKRGRPEWTVEQSLSQATQYIVT